MDRHSIGKDQINMRPRRQGLRNGRNGAARRPNCNLFSRRAEQGSAYIVTLLILFVLTILGLSISMITQLESLAGSQEPQLQRMFYAADSGIGVATAQVLVSNDRRRQSFSMVETRQILGTDALIVSDDVEVSPFVPILHAPCNLCQINQGSDYYEINHAVSVQATRRGTPALGGDSVPLGRKALSVMVEIQPWQLSAESFSIQESDLPKL